MHRISIHSDGLSGYASTTAVLCADLTAAAGRATAAAPELLAPAFGLIGADFLSVYTAAHRAHLTTLSELSAVLAATSSTTGTAATAYTAHDVAYAATLRTAATELIV